MLFTKFAAPLASLVAAAAADGAAIASALEAINNVTTRLQTSVTGWSGDLLGTLPVTIQSAELLTAIHKGTKVAKDSAPLDASEAITVAQQTIALGTSVNTSITAIVAAKPKFDKLLLSPVILLNLQLEQAATDDLSAAIIAKVPAELQAVAEQLVAGISDSFDAGVHAYNPFA